MNREKLDSEIAKVLENFKVEREKKERFNDDKIGDLTGLELKEIISSVIHEEFVSSKHPIINASRQHKLEKALLVIVGMLIVLALVYKTFFYESNYSVQISRDKIYITKTQGWYKYKFEMRVNGEKWERCSAEGQNCSPIFTPFEATYNDHYKFIFVGKGAVFWVSNDQMQVTPVKLIDGSWSFKNDYDDHWTDFDTYYGDNYVQPEPLER